LRPIALFRELVKTAGKFYPFPLALDRLPIPPSFELLIDTIVSRPVLSSGNESEVFAQLKTSADWYKLADQSRRLTKWEDERLNQSSSKAVEFTTALADRLKTASHFQGWLMSAGPAVQPPPKHGAAGQGSFGQNLVLTGQVNNTLAMGRASAAYQAARPAVPPGKEPEVARGKDSAPAGVDSTKVGVNSAQAGGSSSTHTDVSANLNLHREGKVDVEGSSGDEGLKGVDQEILQAVLDESEGFNNSFSKKHQESRRRFEQIRTEHVNHCQELSGALDAAYAELREQRKKQSTERAAALTAAVESAEQLRLSNL
jgi:hypothetical protein